MSDDWLKKLKPGDKVIVCQGFYGRSLETVTAVTPTGRIKIGTCVFLPDGRLVGKPMVLARLKQAAGLLLEQVQRETAIAALKK